MLVLSLAHVIPLAVLGYGILEFRQSKKIEM